MIFQKADPTHVTSRVKNLAFVIAVELITNTIEKYKRNDTQDFPKYQVLPAFEEYSPEQLLFVSLARVSIFNRDVYSK